MAKKVVLLFGVVLTLVGIIGFFNDPIFGIFEVDTLHNVVHILTGVLALAFGKSEASAKMFAKVFGVVYAVVALAGLALGGDKILGLIEANMADHLLHVLLALVFLYVGFAGGGKKAAAPAGPASPPPPAPPAAGGESSGGETPAA